MRNLLNNILYVKYTVSVILSLFLLIGCSTKSNSTSEDTKEEKLSITQKEAIVEGVQTTEVSSNEKSIKDLSKKIYEEKNTYLQFERDGSNFKIENIMAQNSSYTRYQISYQSEGFTISGIMNIPNGTGSFPLVVLNHGYIDPDYYTLGRGLKREQDYLARQGYAVLHTDYRNHAFSDIDESLNGTGSILRSKKYGADAINAVLSVQNAKSAGVEELSNVNSEQVGMLGHSMGGGVTMYALVAAPDIIDAAILYAPVHSQEWFNYKRWREDSLNEQQKAELASVYGDLENLESFINISPESYFGNIKAPVQMYFGTQDESCPISWGDDIEKVFNKHNKEIEYIKYEGEKHEFIPKFNEFMEGSSKFFQEILKN